jgi:hypothetical protein
MGRVRRRVSNNCLAGPSGAIAVASESPVRMVQWTRAVIAGAAEPGQVELLRREGIARISRLRHCHWAAMGQWSSAAPAQSGRLSPSPQASDRSATRRNADACWMRQIGSYRPQADIDARDRELQDSAKRPAQRDLCYGPTDRNHLRRCKRPSPVGGCLVLLDNMPSRGVIRKRHNTCWATTSNAPDSSWTLRS